MDVSLLSWNVRGIKNLVQKGSLSLILKKRKVNVLCFQETKCASWDNVLKNAIWGLNTHDWIIQNSEGLSGGLAVSWDNTTFLCKGMAQCKNWIWVQLENISGGELINIVNIYAPQKPKLKQQLWKQLAFVVDCVANQPTCLVGDFNCIRSEEECANCKYRK